MAHHILGITERGEYITLDDNIRECSTYKNRDLTHHSNKESYTFKTLIHWKVSCVKAITNKLIKSISR